MRTCTYTAVLLIADRDNSKTSIILAENLITIFVNRDWSCIALTANFMGF